MQDMPAPRVCSAPGCEAKLRRSNTTGRCQEHRYIPAAPNGTCAADGCDRPLRSDNRSGYCQRHKAAPAAIPALICAADGCERTLPALNRSGYCKVHAAAARTYRKKPVYSPRDCEDCGTEFTPNSSINRRCRPCQEQRSREKQSGRQKRRSRSAMAVPVTRTCRQCGMEFTRQRTTGAPRSYCSADCRYAHDRQRAARIKKRSAECRIEGCPNPRRSRKADWCEMHYARNRRNGSPDATVNRVANLKCHHCGTAVGRRVMFCSELCRRRDRMGAPCLRLACLVCDAELPEDAQLGTKYCSVDCMFMDKRARQYGISPRDLRVMLAEADGCEICGTPCPDLVVDHCHATHRVRGLLCNQCNAGIGMFADDPVRLRAAADYLQARQSAPLPSFSLTGG